MRNPILLAIICFTSQWIVAQVNYSEFKYDATQVTTWIYEDGGFVGLVNEYRYPVTFHELKDDQVIYHFTYDTSFERELDTVIHHSLRYTAINGISTGPYYIWNIEESKMVTLRDEQMKWGILDTNFKPLAPFEYDLALLSNQSGMALTLKDGLWGVVNYLGESLEPQFTIDSTDKGEEPYVDIPFDGGMVYVGDFAKDRNSKELLKGISMRKDGEYVMIECEELKLYYKE